MCGSAREEHIYKGPHMLKGRYTEFRTLTAVVGGLHRVASQNRETEEYIFKVHLYQLLTLRTEHPLVIVWVF
jgi:hypothetical protein